MPDVPAARRFLAEGARVLERRRAERLLDGGGGVPVRDAVAAYRTADGGFGLALEPDARSARAHPAAISTALRILDEEGAWDEELALGAADWLWREAPAAARGAEDPRLGTGGGGAVFVGPAIADAPHAPWFVPEPGLPPSPVQAGPIAAVLRRRGVAHPWLAATEPLLWAEVDRWCAEPPDPALAGVHRIGRGYALRGLLAFLESCEDGERLERALEGLAPHVAELVDDGSGEDEAHRPLHIVPRPDARAARYVPAATLEAALDRLAEGQRDDGGWTFDWPAWSPAATADWRGVMTVEALAVLRAHGRLPSEEA
jgi:hypothetical protein